MASELKTGTALDPAILDRLEGLDFVARTVVEGFMSGQHRSPHRGSSVEFAQHREYVAGDDVRHVDWRIFAKTGRLVIKEFVEESTLVCHLLVDASESMAFKSLKWSKLDYARWCTAALAHLILSQRDSAGLVVFDNEERAKVPPGNGAAQRHSIIQTLDQTQSRGPTGIGSVLNWIGTRLNRRGIVAIFSDFFDEPEEIVKGLRRLVHGGHEPILFQVLDPQELDFNYEGYLRLDGLEGAGRLKVDPKAIRAAYREEITRHNEELRQKARAMSIDYVALKTNAGVEVALSTYLARRSARARGGKG